MEAVRVRWTIIADRKADDQELFFPLRAFDDSGHGLKKRIWPSLKATSGENKGFSACMELE